jgi:hypothetical protein
MRWEEKTNEVKDECLITIFEGKLFLIDKGSFILLTSPVILNNGTVISTEGMIHLPNGQNRMLREGEFI